MLQSMSSLVSIAAWGAILPVAHAGFSSSASDNIAVYWGMSQYPPKPVSVLKVARSKLVRSGQFSSAAVNLLSK